MASSDLARRDLVRARSELHVLKSNVQQGFGRDHLLSRIRLINALLDAALNKLPIPPERRGVF